MIWEFNGSLSWISPLLDKYAFITHAVLLEPADDPKPYCFMWAAYQGSTPDSVTVLRMYVLMFKNKRDDEFGENPTLYFNLKPDPSLRFEIELEKNEKVHSLVSIERVNRDASDLRFRRGEESLLLIGTQERSLLFDLNRWYEEQMPSTVAGCRNPNNILACYKARQEKPSREEIICCSYKPKTLREFAKNVSHSPEVFFYPRSLSLEWMNLSEKNVVFWLTRGVQSELLREITTAGPIVLIMPNETYRRCLLAGLVPFDFTVQDYSVRVEQKVAREMLLSLCLDQRWANFLLRCAIEWSDGSAEYLYLKFLRWSIQRGSQIKLMADRLCKPLFDQSGVNIDESELKTLHHCVQQLECLKTVISKLPNTEYDSTKHKRALKKIAAYFQVVLWFNDVGLLPEMQNIDESDDVQISALTKIQYPRNKLVESYKKKRRDACTKENKENDVLFIDQLIARNCSPLKVQWKEESDSECPSQDGLYPPPSLQSLLRSFLTDCYCEEKSDEEEDEDGQLPETYTKHCIVFYLLMDLCMILKDSNSAVDQLMKYPAAFKLSPSIIKLIRAFWLLDHEDYDGFFNIMTSQIVSSNDIEDWQHELAINSLLKNNQHKLALNYLLIIKPPVISSDHRRIMIDLAVEQGHLLLAFHARPQSDCGPLLTSFFHSCEKHGKLRKILQLPLNPEEEKAFDNYLIENNNDKTRLIHYLLTHRHVEASHIFSVKKNFNPHQSIDEEINFNSPAWNLLNLVHKNVPEISKRFANSWRKNTSTSAKGRRFSPYPIINNNNESHKFHHKPMSQSRDVDGDVYNLAVEKTLETCLKPDRGGLGPLNYTPFLTAPCATINTQPKFVTQINNNGNINDMVYPKRKVFTGKRALKMVIEPDNEIVKKQQKLNNESRDSTLNG
ncbi:protein ELYS-like [Copidosoma floridanum]|uniref:protein ELYS-like n=1 Tax=Copidosoma floridanum TaxID=29053 RepID=UPI000C6FC77D|nr:protein ELYS-like [Copidosoma floridanum]